jgi:hypothetical protein
LPPWHSPRDLTFWSTTRTVRAPRRRTLPHAG